MAERRSEIFERVENDAERLAGGVIIRTLNITTCADAGNALRAVRADTRARARERPKTLGKNNLKMAE